MDDKAFRFEYNIKDFIKTNNFNNFSYEEYFIPYNKEELIDSPLQELMGYEFNRLFENENNFKYQQEYDFLHSVSENEILPDTINILMDAVYCVNMALFNPILYKELIPVYDNVHLIMGVNNFNTISKFPNLIYGKNINYITIYTELIKEEVNEIKYTLSALFHLYNSTENIDKDLANKFLEKIKIKYNLPHDNFEIKNKENIKNTLLNFLNIIEYKDTDKKSTIHIDFSDFDKFIKLLRNFQGCSKFLNKKKCFCLIQEGEKYYFSFSGYESNNNYDALGKKIKEKLNEYYLNTCKMFQFCKKDENMLSYGYINLNKEFVAFPNPLKESEQSNPPLEKKDSQYSCCERKIFPYIKNKSASMYIFCKYEPCERCKPAIKEQKKQYGDNFMYFAFAKNYEVFQSYIKSQKDMLTKNDDYIYTFITE